MSIVIKEKLDYQDFMQANFPNALKPFYKKRMFIVNLAFALLYISATIYIFVMSFRNGIKIGWSHFMYLFFGLLFSGLSYYLIRREKKIYHKTLQDINDLQTVYTIDEESIKVDNKKIHLVYKKSDIKDLIDLDKWLVFECKNDERIAIYKPNATDEQIREIIRLYR